MATISIVPEFSNFSSTIAGTTDNENADTDPTSDPAPNHNNVSENHFLDTNATTTSSSETSAVSSNETAVSNNECSFVPKNSLVWLNVTRLPYANKSLVTEEIVLEPCQCICAPDCLF